MDPSLLELLYCSQLAPGLSASIIDDIVVKAQPGNASRGVTGVLVFDGQRFFQFMEGPAEAVTALSQSIAQDPRHTGMRVCYRGVRVGARRFANWRMGYTWIPETNHLLDSLFKASGSESLGLFLTMVSSLDIHD